MNATSEPGHLGRGPALHGHRGPRGRSSPPAVGSRPRPPTRTRVCRRIPSPLLHRRGPKPCIAHGVVRPRECRRLSRAAALTARTGVPGWGSGAEVRRLLVAPLERARVIVHGGADFVAVRIARPHSACVARILPVLEDVAVGLAPRRGDTFVPPAAGQVTHLPVGIGARGAGFPSLTAVRRCRSANGRNRLRGPKSTAFRHPPSKGASRPSGRPARRLRVGRSVRLSRRGSPPRTS